MLILIEESRDIHSRLSFQVVMLYFLSRFHVLHIVFFIQAHSVHVVRIYYYSFSVCFRFILFTSFHFPLSLTPRMY